MTQYARPNTDISKTGWTGISDNTNLYANIDESSASEADYNYSTNNAIRTYECKLSGVSDPSSGSGHVVSYRIAASDGGDIPGSSDSGNSLDVAISVYQGATLIATTTVEVPEDPATQTLTLSSGEANAITDYSDLRIRFVTTASGGSGSSRRGMAVFWCELAVPDAVTEQYAVKSGNWNDPTVWSTTAVPTTGTVYSNNYTVTVNVNSAATVVTTAAGTVAVAGGSFVLSNGVTLTANVYAGPTACVTLAAGLSATVDGNAYGGYALSAYGVYKVGTGTLTLTKNAYGGSGQAATGAYNASTGTLAIGESVYGSDSNNVAFGARNSSTGTLTVGGSVYAGLEAAGLLVVSTGTVTVAGSVYAQADVPGLSHNGTTNNVTIGGNAVGGSAITAYGVNCVSSGNVTILGAAISADAPGLGAGVGVTGTGYAIIGSAQTGTGGASPCVGRVHVADLSAATVSVRSSSSVVTLSAEVDLPSPFQPSSVFGGA